MAIDDAVAIGVAGRQMLSDVRRLDDDVVVQEDEELAARLTSGMIAGRRHPISLVVQVDDVRVVLPKVLHKRARRILGSVVDDDQLEVFGGVVDIGECCKSRRQRLRTQVGRNYDAHEHARCGDTPV